MEAASVRAETPQKRRSRGVPERRLAVFMVAPSMALIALVAIWPIVYAIWLSLHEYSLVQAGLSRWAEPAGLGNYIDALKSSEFWTATRITFVFTNPRFGSKIVRHMIAVTTVSTAHGTSTTVRRSP